MYFSIQINAMLSLRVLLAALMGSLVLVCFAQPAAPQVAVEIMVIHGADHIRLSWEEVAGAVSYNIYSSPEANPASWGEPIATVGDSVFTYIMEEYVDELGGAYFFYVTADDGLLPAGMVFVFGGTFNPAEDYTATLSSYYISRYEVTQSEWTSVMDGIYNPDWTDRGQGPTHPAYRISWFDAIYYCNRLSLRDGFTPVYSYGTWGTNPANWPVGWNTSYLNHIIVSCDWNADGYRLPTEMEREFAARGGVTAQQAGTFTTTYAGSNTIGEVAWYRDNSNSRTHPVNTKLPNELSLYNMSGNLWNWVWDIYDTYPTGVHNNPTGSTIGPSRGLRGGNWNSLASDCAVSYRSWGRATNRTVTIGFRVCRAIP